MTQPHSRTASHAMLSMFAMQGIDRAFFVPGESYLGFLDALHDVASIKPVICRHEAGAGFMACADARITGRPALAIVSRGPGATNASIAIHTAQQDGIPLILLIGQVPRKNLRRGAFQEINYERMFGGIAKAVFEPTDASQLCEVAAKAWTIATSPTPGPVIIAVPEDIQHVIVDSPEWRAPQVARSTALEADLQKIRELLYRAERPLIVAGGEFDVPNGRAELLRFATSWRVPVLVSFRRHDLFPCSDPLYAGDLGLANAVEQMEVLNSADLILALGTRLGDITTQGYTFPARPKPRQEVVHVHRDIAVVNRSCVSTMPIAADPVALCHSLGGPETEKLARGRQEWAAMVHQVHLLERQKSVAGNQNRGVHIEPAHIIAALNETLPDDVVVCIDAGSFAAPFYRIFDFTFPRRLIAPISGAMGFATPAAIACQLRLPSQQVVCIAGDGGFMMTGYEMHAAVERGLPILFIVVNNACFGSILIHQQRRYPDRAPLGTRMPSPDIAGIARDFGMQSQVIDQISALRPAIEGALAKKGPSFIEIKIPAPEHGQAMTAGV